MDKSIIKLICIFLFGVIITCPSLGAAHDGGDGGGNDGDSGGVWGSRSNSSASSEEYLMGGGCSWDPNPNGPGIFGSSVYSGRPENIEKGPYQSGTAIEDAEAILLAGYQAGTYTAEQLQEQLDWAQRVNIKISDKAQKVLEQIKNPKPSPPSKKPATSQDDNDDFELILNIAAAVVKNKKKSNKPTSPNDLANIAANEIAKQKIKEAKKFMASWGF